MSTQNAVKWILAQLKLAIFGPRELTLFSVFIVCWMLICSILVIYSLPMNFFPSDRWFEIGQYIALVLGSVTTAAYWWGVLNGKIDINRSKSRFVRSRFGKFVLLFLFLPVLLCGVYWLSFVLAAGRLYTQLTGEAVFYELRVSDKSFSARHGHCLETEDLRMGPFQEICVSEEDYDALEIGSVIIIVGKESALGFRSEKYRLP